MYSAEFFKQSQVFDSLTKEIDPLKEKVKDMLMASAADPIHNVKLIDTLLRLGVSHHFENDIETQLESIFNSLQKPFSGDGHDLNTTSIVFRVFRQYGFKMSCDVFNKFTDTDGKFKEALIHDVKGMLNLYEAAHLRIHGESVLEEALVFTTANLKSLAEMTLSTRRKSPEMRPYLNDSFDAYGTPQELQSLIDALKRWEMSAVDELQDYTKFICKAVLVVFDEIAEEARKEGRSYSVPYAKDALIGLVNNYQAEVKWYQDGMGEVAGIEAFEWLKNDPKIMKALNVIGRLMDDIVSHKFEQLREHCPSSVECYMKQHSLSEKATLEDFEKMLEDAWKDVNEECMRPTTVPRDMLLRHLNFARPTYLCYKHGDGYTNPEYMKDDIRALFVDPMLI
ncbi:hypothetical protein V6N11_042730 [Hibiscus sabdariffa]|uniref:(+)-delta-cadinene synthase n=1 Tax=Hibiscus sabdariffa TaxID=183260 RepID=A0ABR2QXU3_9ROSI